MLHINFKWWNVTFVNPVSNVDIHKSLHICYQSYRIDFVAIVYVWLLNFNVVVMRTHRTC